MIYEICDSSSTSAKELFYSLDFNIVCFHEQACWGEGLVVYSLIVVGLYYNGLSHLAESSSSSWDSGSCRCVVAYHVALG
jgi:hypothetical protein